MWSNVCLVQFNRLETLELTHLVNPVFGNGNLQSGTPDLVVDSTAEFSNTPFKRVGLAGNTEQQFNLRLSGAIPQASNCMLDVTSHFARSYSLER